MGTPIAIDSYAPKVNRYIILGSEPNLIGHNSHLLVVVYAPEEVEVNYRIWRALIRLSRSAISQEIKI
ncbi:MAG: ecotin family protein [Desulfobacterales bacterium]